MWGLQVAVLTPGSHEHDYATFGWGEVVRARVRPSGVEEGHHAASRDLYSFSDGPILSP